MNAAINARITVTNFLNDLKYHIYSYLRFRLDTINPNSARKSAKKSYHIEYVKYTGLN